MYTAPYTRLEVATPKENRGQNERSVEAPDYRKGYPFCLLFYWVRMGCAVKNCGACVMDFLLVVGGVPTCRSNFVVFIILYPLLTCTTPQNREPSGSMPVRLS